MSRFCVVGIGLAPFRAYDTYHACAWPLLLRLLCSADHFADYIYKYHRKILRLRAEKGLPPLADENDIPEAANHPHYKLRHQTQPPNEADYKTRQQHDEEMAEQYAVLTDAEYQKFVKCQSKFGRSQSAPLFALLIMATR